MDEGVELEEAAHVHDEATDEIAHELHENCPDSLGCLRNTDGKPQYKLHIILRCAILGSPNKRLTTLEMYSALENKYPYYKTAGTGWNVCSLCS